MKLSGMIGQSAIPHLACIIWKATHLYTINLRLYAEGQVDHEGTRMNIPLVLATYSLALKIV